MNYIVDKIQSQILSACIWRKISLPQKKSKSTQPIINKITKEIMPKKQVIKKVIEYKLFHHLNVENIAHYLN